MYWSELVERLKTPSRGTETFRKYMSLPKSQQDELKDVGGFVAGTLLNNRRKAGHVIGRDVITLDMDNIKLGGTDDVLRRIDGLGCAYVLYSTRKHDRNKPRLRVLIPLDHTCTADQYEPLARKLGEFVGIELCDPTTFEASRLMYWPSCSLDSEYVYTYGDKPFLSVEGMLDTYRDWRNTGEWPEVSGAKLTTEKFVGKQEDPTQKPGIIGAFCKTYNIYSAVDTFIQGEYVQCDTGDNRLTYSEGSTVGGAVVYDNGNFIYSHHATDPAGGKLCNAFDLVRLHKFGNMDDEAKADTPTNKLPSYTAMCELAVADKQVALVLNQERYDKAAEDFNTSPTDDKNWMGKLKLNSNTGLPAKTIDNVLIILENDPLLKGRIKFDEFASRGLACNPLPWQETNDERPWTDNDDSGAKWYLEKIYGLTGESKIMDALSLCGNKNSFDKIKEYLNSLVWDGTQRLDKLFIDYLGASDTPYTRAITRKAFTAAVARAMEPGTKFDTMIILTGPQGTGKSTLLRKMGKDWFSDSLKTFEGKEASELIQGVWLVEIGELEAFNKSEIGRIKQFLSQCEDIFRAAYGRHVGWHKRRCVFFGTSNNGEYLRDKTGNRRFWPLDIAVIPPVKSVFRDLDDEIDQLWAEALMRWQMGEPLYIKDEIEKAALEEQESHREHSAKEGLIIEFMEREVPEDWNKWPLEQRQMFWNGNSHGGKAIVKRSRICALEVWCEALGSEAKYMKYSDAVEINGVIANQTGWVRTKKAVRFGYCGMQRGFENETLG